MTKKIRVATESEAEALGLRVTRPSPTQVITPDSVEWPYDGLEIRVSDYSNNQKLVELARERLEEAFAKSQEALFEQLLAPEPGWLFGTDRTPYVFTWRERLKWRWSALKRYFGNLWLALKGFDFDEYYQNYYNDY